MKDFFTIIVDTAFILQLVSVAIATAIVFNGKIKSWKDVVFLALKAFFVFAVMFFSQLGITLLASIIPFLVGIGSWLSFLLGISLYAALFCKEQTLEKVVVGCAIFVTSFVVSMFGTTIGMVIAQSIKSFDIIITKISADVFIILFALLLRRYSIFRYELNGYYSILNLSCGVLTSVICIFYNLYEIHVLRMNRAVFAPFVSVLLGCLYLINLFTYLMTYSLCKSNKEVMELQGERSKNKYLEELLSVSESNSEELKKVRHDIKNQYIYMRELLVNKRYDDLEDYFAEMSGTFAKPLFQSIDSGNKGVDSVLNMEIEKALAGGIKMDVKVAVPAQLPFDKTDICRLFANILDNAIEGCLRDRIENAVVEVVSDVRGDYLRFSVVNPTRQTEDHAGKTTSKKDKTIHGYGNKIIKGIVKKYNGIYHHGVENGTYVAEVMIDLFFDKGEKNEQVHTNRNL